MGIKGLLKNLSKIFLITLPALAVAAISAEILLRIKIPSQEKEAYLNDSLAWKVSGIHKLDADFLYTMIPGKKGADESEEYRENFSINSAGFRDEEIDEKATKSKKMFMVGDSFTYGAGISSNTKTLPKLLEKFLNQSKTKKGNVKVYNAGISGYGPDQEYRLITRKLIPEYKPDYIFWNLVIPSDLYDASIASNWPIPALYGLKNKQLVEYDARLNWFYPRNFIYQKGPAFLRSSLLAAAFFRFLSDQPILNRQPGISDDALLLWAAQKIGLQAAVLQSMAETDKSGFMVVFLPNKDYWTYTGRENYGKALELIEKKLNEKKVKFSDITKLAGEGQAAFSGQYPKDWYYKENFHPNEIGVLKFAELVAIDLFKKNPGWQAEDRGGVLE